MDCGSDRDIIKNLFKDIYIIQANYMFVHLDDVSWGKFIGEMTALRDKYKQHGQDVDYLCREMANALITYKERKERKDNTICRK